MQCYFSCKCLNAIRLSVEKLSTSAFPRIYIFFSLKNEIDSLNSKNLFVFSVYFSDAFRGKEIWKGRNSIKKILNGGGGLSTKLIRDAAKFFPRAKLLSAYGASLLFHLVSP